MGHLCLAVKKKSEELPGRQSSIFEDQKSVLEISAGLLEALHYFLFLVFILHLAHKLMALWS